MILLVEQFREMKDALEKECGPFSLFALVRRTESAGRWDLVVASPLLEREKKTARRGFAGRVAQQLEDRHILEFSRIVFVRPESKAVSAFEFAQTNPHPADALNHTGAFGFEAEDVHVIASGQAHAETASA